MNAPRPLYGLMAEFASSDDLLEAARRASANGFSRIEAYTPFAVEGLADAVGMRPTRVPLAALCGGLAGGVGAYAMQWYAATVSYPVNVGGRPLHSWPMFVPVAFEMTILFGALAAVAAMLWGNGLPRLTHPVFDAPDFDLASRNRFFLCLRAGDAGDAARAGHFLSSLSPIAVNEVRR